MAVFVTVCLTDGEFLTIRQDEGGIHVIREKTYIDFCRDELHGNIIADFVNGNGGILAHLTGDAV